MSDVPNLGRKSPTEKVDEAPNFQEAMGAVFRDILANIPVFMGPQPTGTAWQVADLTMNGREVPHAILVMTQNNTVSVAFYNPDELEQFARSTMGVLQMVQQAAMAKMPLIVARPDQMDQAVAAKKEMDGKFGSKKDINWPPADGKFSL